MRERNQAVSHCPKGVTSLPLVWLSRGLFVLRNGGNWFLHIIRNILGLQDCVRNLTEGNQRVMAFPAECAGSVIQIFCCRKLPHQKGGRESDQV